MDIDYHHKYIKYKTKYLALHNKQTGKPTIGLQPEAGLPCRGGSSWNYFSFDNDLTHDKLVEFRNEKRVYFDNDKVIKILKKMFDKYETGIENEDSDYYGDDFDQDFYLYGVIVYLLIKGFTLPITYLKKTLVQLYRAYMIVQSGKYSCDLYEYTSRLECLRIEICLLNYGLNHKGSLMGIMNVIKNNINTADVLSSDITNNHNNSAVIKYIDIHQDEFFDYVYISDNKKFPYLDPVVPYVGTIMKGSSDFYIVDYRNETKKWIGYGEDCHVMMFRIFYPTDVILEGLNGVEFRNFI